MRKDDIAKYGFYVSFLKLLFFHQQGSQRTAHQRPGQGFESRVDAARSNLGPENDDSSLFGTTPKNEALFLPLYKL
jgi:hypothetical protein